MPKTAVVILNWNGKKYLEQFLPGVILNTLSADTVVIMADNGSDDDSVLWVSGTTLRCSHQAGRQLRLCGGYNRLSARLRLNTTYFSIPMSS
jgi:hypothetical protein